MDERAIAWNVAQIKRLLSPGTRLMIAVKANGYGHGALHVVHAALLGGATDFGVASVEEAMQLRTEGVTAPILVLGAVTPSGVTKAAEYGISVAMTHDWRTDKQYLSSKHPVRVHIKVETGMSRLGVSPHAVPDLVRWIESQPNFLLEGIFTHLACADAPTTDHSQRQVDVFEQVLAEIKSQGLRLPSVHVANSAGAIRNANWHYDMVRVGVAAYGYRPSREVDVPFLLRPALGLYGMVTRVIELSPGQTVSYGATYTATSVMRVATVPVGYADGYPRILSNQATVLLGERRVPVVGTVCMDQLMIDVSTVPETRVGDTVTLYGPKAPAVWNMRELEARAADESSQIDWITRTFAEATPRFSVGENEADVGWQAYISLDNIAAQAGTISYELMCALSTRIPRLYVKA